MQSNNVVGAMPSPTAPVKQHEAFLEETKSLLHPGNFQVALIVHKQGGRSCAGAQGSPSKSLDSDKNFKPKHMLFCCDVKKCRDLRTFWKTLSKKKCSFGL